MGTTRHPFFARGFESALARYASALAVILLALLVRAALTPLRATTLLTSRYFLLWFSLRGSAASDLRS